jgi:hypothetical protein
MALICTLTGAVVKGTVGRNCINRPLDLPDGYVSVVCRTHQSLCCRARLRIDTSPSAWPLLRARDFEMSETEKWWFAHLGGPRGGRKHPTVERFASIWTPSVSRKASLLDTNNPIGKGVP